MNTPSDLSFLAVWHLVQPRSLTLTVAACFLGMASAAGCGIRLDTASALATVLLAVLFHSAANLWHAVQVSAIPPCMTSDDPWLPGAGAAWLAQTDIRPAQVRQFSGAVLALVTLAGLALAVKVGPGLLPLGLAGWLLAWSYSARPLQIGAHWLGGWSAALAWWLVTLGADYVQRHHFFVIPAVNALSFALLAGNIAVLRQDLSKARMCWTYAALVSVSHVWLLGGVWLLYQPQRAAWAMVSLPLSLWATYLMATGTPSANRARLVSGLTLAAAFIHALVMGTALLSLTRF